MRLRVYECVFATHFFAVLADVRVNLIQSAQHVELVRVKPRLLSQVRVHILVTDGWQSANVGVVPADTDRVFDTNSAYLVGTINLCYNLK